MQIVAQGWLIYRLSHSAFLLALDQFLAGMHDISVEVVQPLDLGHRRVRIAPRGGPRGDGPQRVRLRCDPTA